MLYDLSKFLHVALVVIWVGGMFFAYMALRPAAAPLNAPERLALWVRTFARFFPWVWLSVILILASGTLMIIMNGGMGQVPLSVHIMLGLGLIMMMIFAHVFFAPYKRLRRNTEAKMWEDAGKALGQIRQLVGINTIIGFIVIFIATAQPF